MMTVRFTDQELKWINKDVGNWTIKDGCPPEIRKRLRIKLKYIYDFHDYVRR